MSEPKGFWKRCFRLFISSAQVTNPEECEPPPPVDAETENAERLLLLAVCNELYDEPPTNIHGWAERARPIYSRRGLAVEFFDCLFADLQNTFEHEAPYQVTVLAYYGAVQLLSHTCRASKMAEAWPDIFDAAWGTQGDVDEAVRRHFGQGSQGS